MVLIHEIFGYTLYNETVTKNLASEGFTAASIDLYRGRNTHVGIAVRAAGGRLSVSAASSQG